MSRATFGTFKSGGSASYHQLLILPSYSYSSKQPDPPSTARIVAFATKGEISNPTIYLVQSSRKGSVWWLSATRGGTRASDTVRTTSELIARAWIDHVQRGAVMIDRAVS